jgi:predicted nucleic acid-binding protein
MRILVDTNVLARIAHKNHPHTAIAAAALQRLWAGGHELRIVPQVLYEFWVVATRPVLNNGLGFSAAVADADVSNFKRVFSVLRDERGILDRWQQLAASSAVIGKQAHDTRLVAAMLRHDLTHLLTFNADDFRRYTAIQLLDPHALASTGP